MDVIEEEGEEALWRWCERDYEGGANVVNAEDGYGMCQAFCVNGLFFCAGILGGGKVGILLLDFHFSTAHSFSSSLSVTAKKTTGFFLGAPPSGPGEHAPAAAHS